MQTWVFFAILGVFIVGMVWGFVVGRSKNSTQRRAELLESELVEMRGQISEYKQQVSQHFAKTADVVNAMTANYRALYDQLIKGAQDLCSDQAASAKLDPSQVRFIEHRRNNVNENKQTAAPDITIKAPPGAVAPAAGGLGSAGVLGAGDGEVAAASTPAAAAPAQGGSVIEQAVKRADVKANGEADEERHAQRDESIAKSAKEAPSPGADDDTDDQTRVTPTSPQGGSDAKSGASETLTVH